MYLRFDKILYIMVNNGLFKISPRIPIAATNSSPVLGMPIFLKGI